LRDPPGDKANHVVHLFATFVSITQIFDHGCEVLTVKDAVRECDVLMGAFH
jgi:hypothetical protein